MINYEYNDDCLKYLKDALKDKVSEEDIDKLINNYLHKLKPIYIKDKNEGLLLYDEEDFSIALILSKHKNIFKKLIDELIKIAQKKAKAKIICEVPNDIKDDYLNYGFRIINEKEDNSELEYLVANHLLNQTVDVIIDHPYGSHHPYRDSIYELNYGYIYNEENDTYINAYIYGIEEPLETYKGQVVGLIYHKEDNDIRLIVASPLLIINKDELIQAVGFEEQYYDTYIELR